MTEDMADFLRKASLIELQMLKQMHEGQHHAAIARAIAARKINDVAEWSPVNHAPGAGRATTAAEAKDAAWHREQRDMQQQSNRKRLRAACRSRQREIAARRSTKAVAKAA